MFASVGYDGELYDENVLFLSLHVKNDKLTSGNCPTQLVSKIK